MQSLAAIGDGLIGPLVRIGRGDAGLERTFVDNRFINWLRIIAPAVEMEDSVFGTPGATSVAVTKQIEDVLELDPAPQAVLVCAGMEDCLAAIKGVAPSPDQTVRALETIATRSLAAGIKPIFIIPPPCTMFSNGLFADRFVAIAATLRRMHRRDPRIGLIDPTDVLMQKRAYGIEPDPAFVAGGSDGRLSSLGAFRLAQLVASYLQDELAVSVFRPVFDREASGTLNANPQLKGSSGVLATKAVTGRCAKAYRIDARQTGGAQIQASVLRRRYAGAQRVTLSKFGGGHTRFQSLYQRYSAGFESNDLGFQSFVR